MPHRQRVEEASRRRGRSISPEVIEELLGFAGPGAIKRIAGVPGLFMTKAARSPSTPTTGAARFPVKRDFREDLELLTQQVKRIAKRANIDRPRSTVGGKLRENIGGQRPPDTELETLALRKQQARKATKSEKAGRKKTMKQRTEFEERLSKLSTEERTRFNELFDQLQETVRRRLDEPRRGVTTQDILDILRKFEE